LRRGLRFTLLTYGSRGDVEPFIALAAGLARQGHSARLAAPALFAPLARDHGVTFSPLPGNPDDLAQALTDRAGLSAPRMVARMIEHVLPIAASVLHAVEEACRECDVIVHTFLMTEAGHLIAHARRLPDFSAQFFPVFAPTSDFPGVALPDLPLGSAYRKATHHLNTAVFRFGGRLLYRKVRARDPDLPPLAPWPFTDHAGGPTPLLFAFSPLVLPQPADWPSYARTTGYWHLPARPNWSPPESLRIFLEEGPPPVFLSVGSMRSRRMPDVLSAFVAALDATGQRGIVAMPPFARPGVGLPAGILVVDDVPHTWLLPRCRMVIHHGGSGTTGAALRSGVPSVAIPFTADQAFWARRIQVLGVGPSGIPARQVDSARLTALLESTLSDQSYGLRARSLAENLRREDGVVNALQIIHERLGLSRAVEEPAR
jgi:sterol 3beta-glucosyltransferase